MRSYGLISLLAGCVASQALAPAGVPPPGGPKLAAITINQRAAPAPTGTQNIKTVIVGGYQPAATPGGMPAVQFVFTPESVTAQPGEVVRFMFMGNNHSVVQTTFEAPCQPEANGFNSGYKPNTQNQIMGAPTMDFSVKDTQPVYLSCLQVTHCGRGMVFSINPPPVGDKTHILFKAAAIRVGNPNLGNAAIQAASPVAQVASTISIKPQGVGAAQATPGAPAASVVPGMGTTGAGQSCACQCLCGAGSFPMNAGQGAFGGVVGAMPDSAVPPAGAMSPANGTVPPPAGMQPPAVAPPGVSPPAGAPLAGGTAPAQGQQGAITIKPGAPAAAAGATPPAVPNAKLRRW